MIPTLPPKILAPLGQPLYKNQINPFSVTDLTQQQSGSKAEPLLDLFSTNGGAVTTKAEDPKKGTALYGECSITVAMDVP